MEAGVFTVEPWAVREPSLRLDTLGQTESIFALSNGHIGLRGNLDEGEPHAAQGTYLNGYYETLPLPYAEGGYGYPEEGQSLINVTDGKLIRLLVDDEPFDVRYGTLVHHERVLDLRAGVLRRDVHWVSTAGQAVRIRSTRLVSFVQRAVVAVHYEVEAVDAPARIVVQSPLVANEPGPEEEVDDPRAAAALRAPLISQYSAHHDLQVELGHQTRRSGLRMAAALDHVIDGPPGTHHRDGRRSGHGAGHGQHRAGARAAVDGDQVSGLWLVERALDARAARPGRRRVAGGAQGPAGRGSSPASARTWTMSGPARMWRSRATRSCSRRCGLPSSRRCRPPRAPSSAAFRPRD